MKDQINIRLDRDIYKKLQYLKLDRNIKSINNVVKFLIEEYEKKDN